MTISTDADQAWEIANKIAVGGRVLSGPKKKGKNQEEKETRCCDLSKGTT